MRRIVICLVILLLIPTLALAQTADTAIRMNVTLSFPYGDRSGVYTGQLQNGKPNGYGCFETQNSLGDPWTYVGEFKNGMMDGEGYSMFIGDVQTRKGTFKDGSLVKGQLINGIGGYIFDGVFSDDDAITGEGKVYNWDNNLIYQGTFENATFMTGTLYNRDGTVAVSGTFDKGFVDFIQDNYVNGYMYY